jgi:hypothetical protein
MKLWIFGACYDANVNRTIVVSTTSERTELLNCSWTIEVVWLPTQEEPVAQRVSLPWPGQNE